MNRRACLQLLPAAALIAAPKIHENIAYGSAGGTDLQLDLMVPEGPGPFPFLLCLHGGGWSMGSRRSFHRVMPGFAEAGYATAAMQYRLAPKDKFPAQLEDTRMALRFLRANAAKWKLDSNRAVLAGASAGAHLALLAAFSAVGTPDGVQAVIDISGPADLRDWRMLAGAEANLQKTTGKTSAILLEELLGGPPVSESSLRQASPLLQVRKGAPPVLVFHWKEDQAVEASQAQRLIKALEENNIPHEAIWFEGRGHAFSGKGVEEIVPRSIQFLNQRILTRR